MPVKPEPDVFISSIMIFQEYITKYMLIPGKIENCIFVVNPDNGSIFSTPVSLIKAMEEVLILQYKCRIRTQFIINASYAVSIFFNTVKYLLDYNTR